KQARHKKLGTSSNASPVTDGSGVFVYFKSGTLAALENDGTIRWQRNLVEEFGAQDLYWDQGSSPIIIGDLLILPRLHAGDSWVGGFDKVSGELRWKAARNYEAPAENDHGYTTPVPFKHEGKDAFLIWCSDLITAHSAESGELLWSCKGFNPEGTKLWPPIATPVIANDVLVVPVGRDDRMQAQVHAVKMGDLKGDVTETNRLWERDDFGVFVCSPVEYEGKVYCLRNKGKLVCLDPQSGEPQWEEAFPRAAAPYYSSPIIAGGVLYAAREDGMVFAAKVGEQYELLSENDMGEQILASPVPFDGKLLIRTAGHLYCVD
ncbi:MAG: PQQ-binding-like beta-propeller repeat protein, partial [Verrucomicrobiota bacterium]